MIQDFSLSGWKQDEEEEEDNEDEEDALSGATRGLSGTTKKWMMVMKPTQRMRMKTKIKRSPEGRS